MSKVMKCDVKIGFRSGFYFCSIVALSLKCVEQLLFDDSNVYLRVMVYIMITGMLLLICGQLWFIMQRIGYFTKTHTALLTTASICLLLGISTNNIPVCSLYSYSYLTTDKNQQTPTSNCFEWI